MTLPDWAARTDKELAAAHDEIAQLGLALLLANGKREALGDQIVRLEQQISDLEHQLAGFAGRVGDVIEAKAGDVHPAAHGNTRSAWLAAARHARGCK